MLCREEPVERAVRCEVICQPEEQRFVNNVGPPALEGWRWASQRGTGDNAERALLSQA